MFFNGGNFAKLIEMRKKECNGVKFYKTDLKEKKKSAMGEILQNRFKGEKKSRRRSYDALTCLLSRPSQFLPRGQFFPILFPPQGGLLDEGLGYWGGFFPNTHRIFFSASLFLPNTRGIGWVLTEGCGDGEE